MAAAPDEELVSRIASLVEREHELRQLPGPGTPVTNVDHSELEAIEVQLDQCWDLLRQRRARREFAAADDSKVRDPSTVEGYQQ